MPANQSDLFAGATGRIDYTDSAAPDQQILPVPELNDSLEVIARKMDALAAALGEGKNLAVCTGFAVAAHQLRTPEELARASITPVEKMQFDAWKDGAVMPNINWDTSRKPVLGGAKSVKRFSERAIAMERIFGVEGLGPEHACWLTSNMVYMLPLVKAVCRVDAARRALAGGQSELTDIELAELQTIHKVVAVANDVVNRTYAAFNRISKDMIMDKNIIQAREDAIKAKMDKAEMANWNKNQLVTRGR